MHRLCNGFGWKALFFSFFFFFLFNVYLSLLIFGCVLCRFSLLILHCVLCSAHFYYCFRQLPFDRLFLITAFLTTDLPSLQIANLGPRTSFFRIFFFKLPISER